MHVYPVTLLKVQDRHPLGHGPHVLLGVIKYLDEQVVQTVALEQLSQPFGQPTHILDILKLLVAHVRHTKS